MSRRVLNSVSWAAVGTLVTVIVLEATVRVDDWAQHGVPVTAPAISLSELLVRDSLGLHARAGAQFRQFQINREGFRGPEVDLEHGALRVVTAGASETFGLYEPQGREWPRQLEDLLRTKCGPSVRVLNAAFAGMSLPTVKQDYERRLRRLSPQVVVYYPTPMQYLESAELPKAAEMGGKAPPLSAWRLRALPRFRDAFKRAMPESLLDLLRQLDTRRQRAAAGAQVKSRAEPERLEAFDRDLRSLVGSYRWGGSEPVLLVHRHRFRDTTSVQDRRQLRAWERFYPRYTAGALLAFDENAAERIRQIGTDSAVAVVDPLSALISLGPKAFADFSHFTEEGGAAVAATAAAAVAPLLCTAP